MRKFALSVSTAALVAASFLPLTAYAYGFMVNPRCSYRDISGRCLQYDYSATSPDMYYYGTSEYTPNYSPYTYPFQSFTNTYGVMQSPYDNRYSKEYRLYDYNYEYDVDDDDYMYDFDDDMYTNTWDDDEDYYYRSHLQPYGYGYEDNGYGTETYEYEHTRIYCENRDCNSSYYRY